MNEKVLRDLTGGAPNIFAQRLRTFYAGFQIKARLFKSHTDFQQRWAANRKRIPLFFNQLQPQQLP
jgi:hypothetical protein